MEQKKILCGLSPEEILIAAHVSDLSLKHAVAIAGSIYKKRINDLSLVPGIPKKLKEELGLTVVPGLLKPVSTVFSLDSSEKYLFHTAAGKRIETVYIPEGNRHTVCVSSQSGCRMGCLPCATGRYGFHGNLTAGEIINQVIGIPHAEKITHVVFMGMGEPMDNAENVLKACRILTAEWGLALGCRNVTVSSVGILPAIEVFLNESGCNLSISLFSPFSEERKRLIPAENKYPVESTINILKKYSGRKKRRFTLSYVMIRDVNDTRSHLEALQRLVKDSGIRINLLPYHRVPGSAFIPSDDERMEYYRKQLMISGISVSVRKSRGADIQAACGLLASGAGYSGRDGIE